MNNLSFDNTSIAFKSKSNSELRKTHFLFWAMNKRFLVSSGTKIIKTAFDFCLPIKGIVKNTLFKQFCGGETIEECENLIQELYEYSIGTVLDYSIEGEENEEAYDATVKELLNTIRKAENNPAIPFSVFKVTGLASFNLLAKIQKGEKLSQKEMEEFTKVRQRVEQLCNEAYQRKVRLLIDAEESWIQTVIDNLCYEMMEKFNRERAIVFNTFQMYRWDMLDNLKKAFKAAQEKHYFLGVKLVRGAYMEKERAYAASKGTKDLIQPNKKASDIDYNKGLEFCIENLQRIELCAGTHNEESNYYLVALMVKKKIERNDSRIYFVQLLGMSDNISFNLSNAGYNVGKYVPYGPVKSVMPYLFRRANENTSIAGQTSREFNLISKEVSRRKSNN